MHTDGSPEDAELALDMWVMQNDGCSATPYSYTVLFVDAGIPGVVDGSSEKFAVQSSNNPVTPEDVAATIYTALGIPLHLEPTDGKGKPYTLCTGKPIGALVG